MKIYFAHPVTLYNTNKESCLVRLIESSGGAPQVVNPNNVIHSDGYAREGMEYFNKLIDECGAVFAYPFEGGCFGAGVGKELAYGLSQNKPAYIIRPDDWAIVQIHSMSEIAVLSVEATRGIIKWIKEHRIEPAGT